VRLCSFAPSFTTGDGRATEIATYMSPAPSLSLAAMLKAGTSPPVNGSRASVASNSRRRERATTRAEGDGRGRFESVRLVHRTRKKKIFHQIRAVRSISVVVDVASVCKIDDSHTVPRFDSITSTYIHTRTVLHLTRARHGIGSHRRVRTEGSRSCRPHGRSVRRSVGRTVRLTMSMDRRTADERSREFAAKLRSSARAK